MEALRFSFVLLFLFGFLCTANSNPITSLFGKSDDKAEADEKTDEKATVTTTTVKAAGDATTTTTAEPSSSCGGLKGFLHICEKSEPTEPPKSVKTRSVPEEDDDDSDSDEDSDEDSNEKEPQQETETSSAASDPAGVVAKRQAEDSEAPVLSEVPPMVGDAVAPPAEPSEGDDGQVEKRQAEDSDPTTDSGEDDSDEVMEVVEGSRRRRDCRDGDGENWKNCRKRREFVPRCTLADCRSETTERQ